MRKLILLISLTVAILANEPIKKSQDKEASFIDIIKNFTFDTNLTDSLKLENITEYIESIEFDDNITEDKNAFKLLGHNENYIMPVGYDNKSHTDDRQHAEAKFQISIKVPLYRNFLNTGGVLYGAYTQNSYWQVYDTDNSSPFRETNHKPELFIDWKMDKQFDNDINLQTIRFSITHQSNGQDIPKSRSWNYNDLQVVFKKENLYFGGNIWYRWSEDAKTDLNSTEGDDNPDLEDYIGKQRIFIRYNNGKYRMGLKHQNKFHKYNIQKGYTELEFIFPSFNKNFDFIIQYFYGYGESLIDYNERVSKISFGILLTDWL